MEILQNSNSISNSDDFFLQKKIEIMMDMHNKRINSELSNIQGMISKLNSAVSNIQRQLSSNNNNNDVSMKKESPEQLTNQQTYSGSANSKETKLTPRYGNYRPEDVSINKFFYCGGSKK